MQFKPNGKKRVILKRMQTKDLNETLENKLNFFFFGGWENYPLKICQNVIEMKVYLMHRMGFSYFWITLTNETEFPANVHI